MTIVASTCTVSRQEADSLLVPRDDLLVAERPVGPGSFELSDGPFRSWARTVEVAPGDGGDVTVSQRVEFRLAVPVFGFLFVRLVRRRALAVPGGPATTTRPWWSPPNRLSARAAHVVGSCCGLAVIGGFIGGLVGQTITFVGSDLGFSVSAQSRALAVIRIGAVLTFVGMAMADRRGRRPLILWSIVIAALAAALGALAPDLAWVTGTQLVCRGLVAVGVLLLPVLAAEEVPAGSRAFITGLITMSGALGVGMVLWVLPLADVSTGAWRWIWSLALLTVPMTLRICRGLPESHRFTQLEGHRSEHPRAIVARRLLLFGTAILLLNLFVAPVSQLQNEFLRHARGFSATLLAVFLVATNTWGGLGVIIGGRVADTRSRHLVAVVGLGGLAVGNAVMYSTHGWMMWAASVFASAVGAATVPSIGVLYPELFGTAGRGTASGTINVAAVVGGVIGLPLAGWLIERHGYGTTMWWLTLAPLACAVLLFWIPETARRSLEDINAEPPDPPMASGSPE